MYVAGASVAKVGEVVECLTGTPVSASVVSRVTADLRGQFAEWQKRKLPPHYRIFYLDAVRYQVRHKEATDRLVVLAVLAVDLAGKKEVLALRADGEETKAGWVSILNEVRRRGVKKVDVIVSDGQSGLTVACDEIFKATPTLFVAQNPRYSRRFSSSSATLTAVNSTDNKGLIQGENLLRVEI